MEPVGALGQRIEFAEGDGVDDRALLRRLGDGDDTALSELHERHVQSVYWFACDQLGSTRDAEEVTQDAFLLLWRKCRRIELAGASCLPWLLATAAYLARNARRSRTRRERHVTEFPAEMTSGAVVEDDAITVIEMARVGRILRTLSAEDQAVFDLCLLEGLSYKQAASRLRTTHAAVRNRLSRVRGTLRKEMGR